MILPRSSIAKTLILAGALSFSAAGCKEADPNAPATWIAKLDDQDPKKVIEALNTLRKMKAKEAVNAVVPLLKNGNGEVREAAAYALGEFGDKSAVEPLIAGIDLAATGKGADRANAKIAEALGALGDTKATPELMKLTAAKNDMIKLKAVESLGKLKDPKATATLVKFIDDENAPPLITKEAIIALGNMKAVDAIPTLTKALVIERKGISFILESSFALLQTAPSSTTAITSIMTGEDKAYATWAEQNKRKPVAYVVKSALVLGDLADKSTVPALTKTLTWKDPTENSVWEELVHAHAAEALGRMRVKEAAGPIAAQIGSVSEANMRAKYAMALVQIGDKSVLAKMEAAVKDKKSAITARGETLTGLAMMGDGKQKPLFEALQKTENGPALTAQCIKEAGDDGKALCEKLYGDWGKLLTEEAARLEAGEQCHDDVACWSGKLKDPVWKIRERAAYELGKATTPAAVEALLTATKDEETHVRRAVYVGLDWATQNDATKATIKKATETLNAQFEAELPTTKLQIVNEDLKRVIWKAKAL